MLRMTVLNKLRRLAVLIAGLMVVEGCAYCPNYELGPPSSRQSAWHDLHVAIAPTLPPGKRVLTKRPNCKAVAALIAKHLANEKLFTRQDVVTTRFDKYDNKKLARLQSKGYDVVLISNLVRIWGYHQTTALTTTGAVLTMVGIFPGALLIVVEGLSETPATAYSELHFKLVNTKNGRTIWEGTGHGSSNKPDNEWVKKVMNESLKVAMESLIVQIRNANFNDVD